MQGYNGTLPHLQYRPETWTKVAIPVTSFVFILQTKKKKLKILLALQVSNIIFVDSPVGAGFSYSVSEEGQKSSDTIAIKHLIIFLKKVNNPTPPPVSLMQKKKENLFAFVALHLTKK